MIRGQPYVDRREAGQILSAHIREQFHPTDAVVLALPPGGVPVGFEVARALEAPLDVFVVRRLSVPREPEIMVGAIASGGYELLDEPLVARLGITPLQIAEIADRETDELRRQEARYRAGRLPVVVRDRVIYLIDDGLATDLTLRAAAGALREHGVRRVILAVPVGAEETCEKVAGEVDDLICPVTPAPFHSVGLWYRNYEPVPDQEVQDCLAAAAVNLEAAARLRA